MVEFETLESVIQEEKELQFSTFTHALALELLQEIVSYVQTNYAKGVTVHIEYAGLVVAHYLMDGRKDSAWVSRKVKTVMESGHSSLYTWLAREENQVYMDWEKDETYAICGGGFPIFEGGCLKGCIIVSGLEHREDHKVIVHVLQELLEKHD